MTSSSSIILLWIAAISSGLIAGVYFAFSAFIMQAFGKIHSTQGISAMNAINETILRSAFMPLFFASSIISLWLIFSGYIHWGETGSELTLLAGAIYFTGMFACTVIFNVPLNNALAAIDDDSKNTQIIWSDYLKSWTRWNHLRTFSSLCSCIICIYILSIL